MQHTLRRAVLILAAALLLMAAGAGAEDVVLEIPETENSAAPLEPAAASGSRLSAEEVVLHGETGGVRNLCVFSGTQGRLISTEGKVGFTYIWTGDGSRDTQWKITSATGSLCAYARIGTSHHAAVRVMARQNSWAADVPDEEKFLWIVAYNSSNPAIRPASTQRRMIGHGDLVSFETGCPGAVVELLDEEGALVTTAEADEKGRAIFDKDHAADGEDHYISAEYSFGSYDYHAATAYASSPANLTPSGGGTGIEWVLGNDCATFQSRVLAAGGFPVYAAYASSTSSPGGALRQTLTKLVGSEYFKTEFTIEDFHEGDIVWGHNMGHALYCSAVNAEEGTIHTYAHSTKASSVLSDNGWAPITEINAVMQMVQEEEYGFEYRIDGDILSQADLVLPASLRQVDEEAFRGIPARCVYIPDGCAVIGPRAFADCRSLRRIRIPAGCAVDASAFDGCSGFTVFGAPGSAAERYCQGREGVGFAQEQ